MPSHKLIKKTLPNCMDILLIPMKNTDIVSVGIFVKTGSRYETSENNGIAHFLEHMMFKGTKKRPSNEISKQLDNVGAIYNAATSYETTYYFVYGHKENAGLFVDVMVDLYSNPQFLESDIKTERNVVLEEFNMYYDEPSEIIFDMVHDTMFSNSSLKFPILGSEDNIKNFNRDDLVKFRKKFYSPSRTVMAISGDFNEKEIYSKIVKLFNVPTSFTKNRTLNVQGTLNIKKIKDQCKPFIYIKENYDIAQTHVMIAFRTHSMYDVNSDTLGLIEDLLSSGSSSRLYDLLRNKLGITYFNSSDNVTYINEGVFLIHIGVDNKKVLVAINAIIRLLEQLKTFGITQDEYKKIKKLKTNSFLMSLQDPRDFMKYYGINELFNKLDIPLNKPRNYNIQTRIDKINNITKERIEETIRGIFIKQNLNVFIYGHLKDKKKLGSIISSMR